MSSRNSSPADSFWQASKPASCRFFIASDHKRTDKMMQY
jgi:hypothetical protein